MDIKNLIKAESKDTIIYFFSTLITGFGSFIIIPIYWSKFSLSDYGLIAITEMVASSSSILLGLSLEQGVTRFFYEWNEIERKVALGSLWLTSWVSIFLMSPILFYIFFIANDLIFPNTDFFPHVFLGLVIGFLAPFEKIPAVTLRMLKKPILFSGLNIFFFIISHVIAIIFVFVYDLGIIGYLYSQIISKIILLLIYTFLMLNFATPVIKSKFIKEPVLFSLHFITPDVISAFSSQGDRYLLQLLLNLKFLGIYSICQKFGLLFTQIHSIVKLSFVPFLVKTTSDNSLGNEILKKMVPFYVSPLFFGFVFLSLFADNLIFFIGNEEFYSITGYLPWFFLSLLIPSIYLYYAPGIYLSKKSVFLLYPIIGSSAFFFLLSFILIPLFSLHGLIFSKIISGIIYLGISLFLSKKLYNLKNDYIYLSFIFSGSIIIVFVNEVMNKFYLNYNQYFEILFFLLYLIGFAFFLNKKWKNL